MKWKITDQSVVVKVFLRQFRDARSAIMRLAVDK
jgi:hypothetical protein